MYKERVIETDVLIIGGGLAGSMAAIKAREAGVDVCVVDKNTSGRSGASAWADVFWGVFNPEWGADFDTCMKAMAEGGQYLNNQEWDRIILNDQLELFNNMKSWGIEFPGETEEYANTFPPFTGSRIKHRHPAKGLRKQAEKVGARILDKVMVTDLLTEDGTVKGAIGLSVLDDEIIIFKAKATILTAGSNSFKQASEMTPCTGDAEAMAYRAGAEITGKEFGSSTWVTLDKNFIAGRMFHGMVNPAYPVITNADGEGLAVIHSEGDVEQEWTMGIENMIRHGEGPFFWDTTHASPEDMARYRKWQTDTHSPKEVAQGDKVLNVMANDRNQVAGGYAVGYSNVGTAGIYTYSTKCDTNLKGLYAAGDCGGSRHNGSMITNPGLGASPNTIIGGYAGKAAAEFALTQDSIPEVGQDVIDAMKEEILKPAKRNKGFTPRYVTQILRNTMLPYFVSYIKSEERMQAVLTIVEFIRDEMVPYMYANDSHEVKLALEAKDMTLNAEMMLRASLYRKETRGMHCREDYPKRDDENWLVWTKLKEENGKMIVFSEPVPEEWGPQA